MPENDNTVESISHNLAAARAYRLFVQKAWNDARPASRTCMLASMPASTACYRVASIAMSPVLQSAGLALGTCSGMSPAWDEEEASK